MGQFIKNKFFLISLIVCLSLVIIPSTLSMMGLGDVVGNGIMTVLSPVQKLFAYVSDGISGFTDYFTEYDRLAEENTELKAQLAEMRDKISSAEELEQMNEWLFDYLELKREHTDFDFRVAKVTGYGGNYITAFTLDKGSSAGIEKGMTVVTNDGVVGYITETGGSWSKVLTLIESNSTIGAQIERTGEIGLAEGDFSLAAENKFKVTYLAADSDVKVGDRIVTTGAGSVYPAGLVIGYVSSVYDDTLNRTKIATADAAVDLSELSDVMIITGDGGNEKTE